MRAVIELIAYSDETLLATLVPVLAVLERPAEARPRMPCLVSHHPTLADHLL